MRRKGRSGRWKGEEGRETKGGQDLRGAGGKKGESEGMFRGKDR